MVRRNNKNDRSKWIDISTYSADRCFDDVVLDILPSLNLINGLSDVNIRDFYFLITELARLYKRYGGKYYFVFPLGNNYWSFPSITNISHSYNPNRITRNITKIVKEFEKKGYIDIVKGYRSTSYGANNGRYSRVKPTNKFIKDIYNYYNLANANIKRHPQSSLIKLKDKNKKLIKYNVSNNVRAMYDVIIDYNKILSSNKINIPSQYLGNNIITSYNSVYRVFNKSSFSCGGRFYGAWWQWLNGVDRKYITINGNKTVELDYETQVIYMIYGMAGAAYNRQTNGDAYTINNLGINLTSNIDKRKLVKKMISISLNASSKRAAIGAVNEYLLDEYGVNSIKLTYIDYTTIVNSIFNKHPILNKYFYTGIGMVIMNKDSIVCEYIIKELTKKNICVLTVHDSFIVEEQHKSLLELTMKDAYIKNNMKLCLPMIKVSKY